nr:hypothetical protein [Haladaptatus pallidirubidus]
MWVGRIEILPVLVLLTRLLANLRADERAPRPDVADDRT